MVKLVTACHQLLGTRGNVKDAAGRVWSAADIRDMSAVIMVFTMLFSSLLAAIKLAQTARDSRRVR
ncbi:MAG TPA: hypothetical protein PKE16_09350 [Hyphomicrobium sp.]|nr:hypothetical protein [Hyphomicrobium sp.]